MKTKNTLLATSILCIFCLSGCGNDTREKTADISVTLSYEPGAESPNHIIFSAQAEGEYGLMEWVFPDGNIRKNQTRVEYYFPKRGEYTVQVIIWQDGKSASDTQTVTIAQDDPDYEGPALIWSDEFEGPSLNTANWTVEKDVRVNNELQQYIDGNYEIRNGSLVITAKKVDDNKQYGSYTSARIITYDKREFKYGRMEIRAKLPLGLGIWPAIWMLGSSIMEGTSWPTCGEIDIMEYVGFEEEVIHGSLHNAERNGGNSLSGTTRIATEEEFHIYGLNWTADRIEFYVDDRDNPYYTYVAPATKTPSNWPFDNPAFFILNVAVGGDWGGARGIDNSIFPVSMEVDYVRVYENE